jgi:hypothetical protein
VPAEFTGHRGPHAYEAVEQTVAVVPQAVECAVHGASCIEIWTGPLQILAVVVRCAVRNVAERPLGETITAEGGLEDVLMKIDDHRDSRVIGGVEERAVTIHIPAVEASLRGFERFPRQGEANAVGAELANRGHEGLGLFGDVGRRTQVEGHERGHLASTSNVDAAKNDHPSDLVDERAPSRHQAARRQFRRLDDFFRRRRRLGVASTAGGRRERPDDARQERCPAKKEGGHPSMIDAKGSPGNGRPHCGAAPTICRGKTDPKAGRAPTAPATRCGASQDP